MVSSVTAQPAIPSIPSGPLLVMGELATQLLDLWKEWSKAEPEVTIFPEEVFTCEGVAQALEIKVEQVGKAMVVQANGKYGIVLLSGKDRLDVKALKSVLSDKKASIVQQTQVTEKTGMTVGAVTPLMCLKNQELFLVIDSSLRGEDKVNISTGDLQFGLNVNPSVLAGILNAQWASISTREKV